MTTTTQDTYLTERIAEQERYLASLEALYADLRDGTALAVDWDENLLCDGAQEIAIDQCGTEMDHARIQLERMQEQAAQAAHGNAGDGD